MAACPQGIWTQMSNHIQKMDTQIVFVKPCRVAVSNDWPGIIR